MMMAGNPEVAEDQAEEGERAEEVSSRRSRRVQPDHQARPPQ